MYSAVQEQLRTDSIFRNPALAIWPFSLRKLFLLCLNPQIGQPYAPPARRLTDVTLASRPGAGIVPQESFVGGVRHEPAVEKGTSDCGTRLGFVSSRKWPGFAV